MSKDAILLILGAVAGVIAQVIYSKFARTWQAYLKRHRMRLGQRKDDPKKHVRNTLEIYKSHELAASLYCARNLIHAGLIPLLYDSIGYYPKVIDTKGDDIVAIKEIKRVQLPTSDRLIEKRIRQGVKLWDGELLYLSDMKYVDGVIQIEAGVCNYFSYVSFAQRIKKETARRNGAKPLLVGSFRSFESAISSRIKPLAISASTTCVYESKSGPMVAIHRRSSEVVDSSGMFGIIPIFGLESNETSDSKSDYGLLAYNFLKEYTEEMFDLETVVRAADRPRGHIDWVLQSAEARELTRQLESRELTLTCGGVAFNPGDGSIKIALLAHFSSHNYFEEISRTATGSWEAIAASRGNPAVGFTSLYGPRIDQLATVNTMDPGSLFSLDRAKEILQ